MTQRELRKQVEELIRELIRDREIYQRKPWTCTVLRVYVNGDLREIYDFSKAMYPDVWDTERGIELAEQKAVAALAKELVKELSQDALNIGRAVGVFVEGSLPVELEA